VKQGIRNSEACRTVGVNRRTGSRWIHGRTITSPAGKTYHYRGWRRRTLRRRCRPGT
jgi:hypothetical protein